MARSREPNLHPLQGRAPAASLEAGTDLAAAPCGPAPFADHNAGRLHGRWIDADQPQDNHPEHGSHQNCPFCTGPDGQVRMRCIRIQKIRPLPRRSQSLQSQSDSHGELAIELGPFWRASDRCPPRLRIGRTMTRPWRTMPAGFAPWRNWPSRLFRIGLSCFRTGRRHRLRRRRLRDDGLID